MPSTGTYYSPCFLSDTSHLRAKGHWMRNHGLATKTIMQMLPSTSLCIQKNDGYPDSFGQLWKFTDVYCIDIHCCNFSDSLNMITLTGVHVPDCHICVPPNVLTLSDKCWISYGKSQKDNNESLRQHFVKELCKSTNN